MSEPLAAPVSTIAATVALPSREVRTTTCNRDCPDACTIRVTVEADRAVQLQGDPDDPITRGFLCERTNRFLVRQYASDRFTRPQLRRRRGDPLQPVTWEEALDFVADRLLRFRAESGPASILHYRSGGSLGILKALADHLFAHFGPVTTKRGDICSGAGERANELDFGVSDASDIADLGCSRLIVLWGKNVHVSGPHLVPVLLAAKKKGARIIGIDPVRTRAAGLCDRFLTPRPGSDYAIAMACARWAFENGRTDPDAETYCENLDAFRALAFERTLAERAREADLEPALLEALAVEYGTTRPAAILVGWGMGRRRNGSRTIRAVDALAAVTGNLGVPGGGASYYIARRSSFDYSYRDGDPEPPRTLAEARLGHEILEARDPAIRALWVTAGNPASMLPDSGSVRRALAATELVVVVDTHPTDTTDLADVVLPTLTLLEDSDLLGAYGNHFVRTSRPALDPPGEAKHELAIWQGLAERVGLGSLLAGSVEDWKRRLLGRLAKEGVTLAALETGPRRNPFAPEVLFEGRRFPTPSGKARLLDRAAEPPRRGEADYPLLLLATSTPHAQSSQAAIPRPPGPTEARVHPDAALGLADGARARLVSRVGSLEVVLRHDPTLRRDVVALEKGGMRRDGRAVNDLVAAIETDDGGGAAYYDEPVRVVAA